MAVSVATLLPSDLGRDLDWRVGGNFGNADPFRVLA